MSDLLEWVNSDFGLRSAVLYSLGLLIGLVLFLIWLLLRGFQARQQPAPERPRLQPVVPGPAFAMLVRERRGDGDPRTLHMVQLFAGGAAANGAGLENVKLPECFLDPHQRRYAQAELDRFNRAYSAWITCEKEPGTGADKARVKRMTTRDSRNADEVQEIIYQPIRILKANSITPFDLAQDAVGHELQEGDVLQFGSLHYRFVLLAATPGDAAAPARRNGAHTNGAGHPFAVGQDGGGQGTRSQ